MQSMKPRHFVALFVFFWLAGSAAADAFTLVTLGGGNWSNTATWLQNAAPATRTPGSLIGTIDTVSLTQATYTTTVDLALAERVTVTTTCPSNTSTCVLDVPAGGGLRLTGSSAIGSDAHLKLSGGTIDNAGTLNLNAVSNLDWSAGTLQGSGQTAVAASANVNLTGASSILSQQLMNLSGTLTYGSAAGGCALNNGGSITILSGGVMDIQNVNGIGSNAPAVSTITVNSGGTFKKSLGAFGTNITPTLNNAGTVQTDVSTLVISNGTHSGIFRANGATTAIQLSGTAALNNGTDIQGTGTTLLGNVTISGTVTATNVQMDSFGSISGTGSLQVSGKFNWRGGSITTATVKMLLGSTLDYTGESAATLTASGKIDSNGTINLNPGVGSLSINNGGFINNTGDLNLVGDVTINSDGVANARIDNVSGSVITKTAGAGLATFNVSVNNFGDLASNAGNIQFRRNGDHNSGYFKVCDSCFFDFAAGTHTLAFTTFMESNTGLNSVIKLSGTATFDVTAGGAYVGIGFVQTGGTVTGAGIWNLSGPTTWSGGTQSGTGSTYLAATYTHLIDGTSAPMILTGRTLENHGTALNYTAAGPNFLSINANATIDNYTTFNLGTDAPINGDGTGLIINRFATFAKISGTGISRIKAQFDNTTAGGVLNVSSGQVALNAGGTNSQSILVPNATNAVVIEAGTFTLAAGTTTGAGLGAIKVDGGTLTLSSPLTLKNVDVASGTLTGSDLTISNALKWTGGTILGPGTTTIDVPATLSHLAPTLPTFLDNRALTNNGTIDYEGSGLQLRNNAVINNNGTFNVRDGFILNGGGTNTLNNNSTGTLKKVGTASGMRFDVPIVNSGTISSETASQSLIINGGGSMSTGAMNTTGGFIDFFGGTFTVTGGTFSGTGQHRVNGGTLQINANLGPPAITLALMGGTLGIASSMTLQVNSLSFTGGTLQGPGTLRTFGGSIGNTSPTTISNGATLTIPAASFTYAADSVNFLTLNDTSKLNVESGAAFSMTNDAPIAGAATAAVTNSGTFLKTAGGGSSQVSPPFSSSLGSAGATSGTLLLAGGGAIATTINTGGAAVVAFSTGTFAINSGASVTGTGTIAVQSGTVNVNVALAVPRLALTGGTLSGSAVTVSTLADIKGAAAKTLNVPLTNNGTLNVEGGAVAGSGPVQNNGTFNRSVADSVTFAPPFTNAGNANFNAGTIAFNGGYTQTGGVTTLNGGTFSSPSVVNLNGGTLQGAGTINASVANNSATVAPGFSPGILTINGNYSQSPSGVLNIQLGGTTPGSGYDQLNVLGSATLAGTINVTLINAFTLSSGDLFNAVTYASHSGVFAPENLPPFPSGTFASTYTPAAYQLAATVPSPADISVTKTGPTTAKPGEFVTYTIVVTNLGQVSATGVIVNDITPQGLTFKANSGDCTTPFPCSLGTLAGGDVRTILASYKVGPSGGTITNTASVNVTDANNANNMSSAVMTVSCANSPITGLKPTGTAGMSGTLTWTPNGSQVYEVFLGPKGSGCTSPVAKVFTNSYNYAGLAPNSEYEWRVEGTFDSCPVQTSDCVTFKTDACEAPDAPLARVVGEATSAKSYDVEWDPVANGVRFELQEATNAGFTDAVTFAVNGRFSQRFTHDSTKATAFYYRVRAFSNCNDTPGPYSPTIRVVIVPPPAPNDPHPTFNVPVGSDDLLVHKLFIPGQGNQTFFYSAAADREWLFVTPPTGVLPPQGITLDVVINPHGLPNGTWTATIIVTLSGGSSRSITPNASSISTPISVNLVTPVTPVSSKPGPSQYSLIVPGVGHLSGIDSAWQTDVRVTNAGFRSAKYRLVFTPAAGTATGVKQTDITVDAGATTALDDIARTWFGYGSLGDGESGMLEVTPLDDPANTSLVTVASSRTYNVTQNGTLGQFVPAVPFPSFIGKPAAGALSTILSLQQIAQSNALRTNVGVAEASGKAATALISIFNASGSKLTELTQSIAAGQQLQLNALLAQNNITLNDGRVEVKVSGGDGKVTAYASVIDNGTGDPLLVSGVPLNQSGAAKYVLVGAANLNNGFADWRTDMRIFNYGTVPQTAALTFYPMGSGTPSTAQVLANPGEVVNLDNVVRTLFGGVNTGGAVHVTTPQPSSLIVSGRTFNQTANGTFGQFIPAVTVDQGAVRGGRSLNILQVEDSIRFRTNLALAELSGKPATVEVQIVLPDSKITPLVQVPLAANEFRQFNVIRELNLGNVYNARIAIRVIDGDGRVTAAGSLIDELTGDPAFLPAQ